MKDIDKTKQQLLEELADLRHRIAELEALQVECQTGEVNVEKAQEQLRSIFESVSDGVAVTDVGLRITDINEAGVCLFGYNHKGEIIGRSGLEFVSPKDHARAMTDMRRTLEKGHSGTLEYTFLDKKGSEFVAEYSIAVMRDKSGSPVGFVATMRDVSEQRKAEEALRLQAEVLHNMAEGAVITRTKDAVIIYTNPRFEEMFGYSPGELIGKNISVVNAPSDKRQEEITRDVQRSLKKRGAWRGEVYNIKKDGTPFWCYANVSTFHHPEYGDVWVATHSDITEQKKAEETLSMSEAALKGIVNATADSILLLDCAGTILLANESTAERLGKHIDELLGVDFVTLLPSDLAQGRKVHLDEVVRSGKPVVWEDERQGIFFESCAYPICNAEGEVVQLVVYARDLTERKRVEEALKRSEQSYRELAESITDIFFALDKELRIIYWNKASERVTGVSPKDALGKHPHEFFPIGEETGIGAKASQEMVRTGQFQQYITRHRFGGKDLIFEVSLYPWRDGRSILAKDITERVKTEEALRMERNRLYNVMDVMPMMVCLLSPDYHVVFANRAFRERFGESQGRHCYEYCFGGKEPCDFCETYRVLKTGKPHRWEVRSGDGSIIDVHDFPFVDVDGSDLILEVDVDITERERADEALKESEAKYRALFETAAEGILVAEVETRSITYSNTAASKMFGYNAEEFSRLEISKLHPRESVEQAMAQFEAQVKGKISLVTGLPCLRRDGTTFYADINATPVGIGGKACMAGFFTDVTERKLAMEQLRLSDERHRSLSITDELTGLHNRRHFYQVLDAEINRAQRYGFTFALVMLDLDRFKEYNDRFGHMGGDVILKSFAQMLKSALRKADVVFRHGGDEFAVIMPQTNTARVRKVIDRISSRWLAMSKLEYPIMEYSLGFSAGVAQYPENAETADGLVFMADTALYHSKTTGGYKSTLASELGSIPSTTLSTATLDQVYALASTVDARDPCTYGHSKRVAIVSEAVGRAMGLKQNELDNLYAAAILHDIGKIGTPDSILTKRGKLARREWGIMRKHPTEAVKIVTHIRALSDTLPIIMHHHEWYDGTGYPDRLKGESIPLGARIVAVADAYDTMTTPSLYRTLMSQEEALEELNRCSGTQFDPAVVEILPQAVRQNVQEE